MKTFPVCSQFGGVTSEQLLARNAFAKKALSSIMIRSDEKLDCILHNMSVFQKVEWGSTAVFLKKIMDGVCVDCPEQILSLRYPPHSCTLIFKSFEGQGECSQVKFFHSLLPLSLMKEVFSKDLFQRRNVSFF